MTTLAQNAVIEAIKVDYNFLCGLELPEYGLNVYLTYLGGEKVKYDVYLNDRILFAGDDFRPSPLHNQDDLESIISLFGFITLKPGDTDSEYFDNYNEMQLAWANSFECEQLKCRISDFEGSDEYKDEATEYFNKYFI